MTSAFALTSTTLLNWKTGFGGYGRERLTNRPAIRGTSRRQRTSIIVCDAGGSDKVKDTSSKDGDGDNKNVSELALPDLSSLFSSAGDPDCDVCHGDGVIPCVLCDGKGYFTLTMMDTVSSTQCRLCKGKRVIPCPSCRKEVYKSVLWWDLIPSKEDDPEENWREGPDGEPRIRWSDNPANPGR